MNFGRRRKLDAVEDRLRRRQRNLYANNRLGALQRPRGLKSAMAFDALAELLELVQEYREYGETQGN